MKRTARIKRICDLKRLSENGAVARMRAARHKLIEARRLLVELERYRADYRALLRNTSGKGLSVPSWQLQREFLDALERAMAQQCEQIEFNDRAVSLSRKQWRQRHREVMAVEAFMDRVARQEQSGAEKSRQAQDDDLIAARQYYAGLSRRGGWE